MRLISQFNVVAADDGVMPQTIEAINHAEICQLQKLLLLSIKLISQVLMKRVKQELSEYELIGRLGRKYNHNT